ncbi:tetratricopeptide repeat protein [Paralcaligenes ureilyticus]|uniref:Tetratricopeptide repeat protein n=1 Tax=Paralcaligenes ureilyticus TaxID=627131 RepID=A0A4R3MBF4_9BURK|nr:tetratricopeptide repeat protein [Paralcaligenes ureilyticus]TCT10974.1 tetratricopeptide repeat protein [Paralcaligenes ureilyticus]
MKLSISLSLAALAGSCLLVPVAAHARQAAKAHQQTESIHLRDGQLPDINLTADLMYRILAAEIGARDGQYDLASQTFLDLAKDTSDPRLAKRAFQFSMADRNIARALIAAREWVQLAPNDPEAVASSLALAATNGQTTGLAGALWARIDKAKNKEEAIAQAAAIVGKMTDKTMALEVLDRALHDPVRSLPMAHMALADAAWAARDPNRALSEAQQALALDEDSELAAQRILEYGLKVDPGAAINAARVFSEKHPDARKLQLMLVGRLTDRKDFDGALDLVKKMRDSAPEDFDLLYTEAEVNFRAQRYSQAQALLNEYISVQTQRRKSLNDNVTNAAADASDARLLLVQIAEKQGHLNEAIVQLGLIDDPTLRFQARIHQAVLQARLGDLSTARSTIAALKPDGDHERAVIALTLSSIYRDAGRTDLATEVLVEANKAMPDTSEIMYDLGMLYERQGKFDEFEKLMQRVIDIDPKNANAYNSLGYTFVDQNVRLDEAQNLLDRALELEPDNPFILDSVGWYLYRTGDNRAALDYLQRSYDQLLSADVAAHLGEVLWKLKRRDEAKKIWHAGLAKDPKNEALLGTMKRFGVKP